HHAGRGVEHFVIAGEAQDGRVEGRALDEVDGVTVGREAGAGHQQTPVDDDRVLAFAPRREGETRAGAVGALDGGERLADQECVAEVEGQLRLPLRGAVTVRAVLGFRVRRQAEQVAGPGRRVERAG